MHADNESLQQFSANLPRILQHVFHSTLPSAAAATASAGPSAVAIVPPVDVASLRAKYAFDATVTDGDEEEVSVASASLAAPPALFSLAAFLDQHLQPTDESSGVTTQTDSVAQICDELSTCKLRSKRSKSN